ncbi:ATP-dependent Clp protease proteolytic subunit 2 [compost metagenome]
MEIEMKLMLDMKQEINEFVTEKTGQTLEWVNQHMERDSWFRGQKAADVGLVDKVITSVEE